MVSTFDGNCSPYWSYSPYPYCNSYDTSSSNSSYFESPVSSSSPRMMMFPVYDQQQQPPPCYYYVDPSIPCQQFPSLSPPVAPSSSQQVNFRSICSMILNLLSLVDHPCSFIVTANASFVDESSQSFTIHCSSTMVIE